MKRGTGVLQNTCRVNVSFVKIATLNHILFKGINDICPVFFFYMFRQILYKILYKRLP